jgi:HSP20 family protein
VTDAVLPDFGQDVRVDVVENENNIVVTADLPGMDKSKIDITLDQGRILTIAGTREMVSQKTAPGMVRQERMVGKFQRAVELPAECMNDGIKANYKDGVLTVDIQKKKLPKKEVVKVKVQ